MFCADERFGSVRGTGPGHAAPPGRRATMTAAVFFGCTFIAFGPAIALFLFTIARDPLRVIFLIAG